MPLNDCVKAIAGTDGVAVFHATQSVRKLLSKERNPPIDRVIEAGLVAKLVLFLDMNDKYVLRFRLDFVFIIQARFLINIYILYTQYKHETQYDYPYYA